MISLAGKAALVTGGSRGIGAATVKLLAQAGADVVFSYHQKREAALQMEQDARKHGTRIESSFALFGHKRRCDQFRESDFGRTRAAYDSRELCGSGVRRYEHLQKVANG
jgi:NAD(P)-dependent dehydrogenase (short-subunit alcohol dehydrogenase family)